MKNYIVYFYIERSREGSRVVCRKDKGNLKQCKNNLVYDLKVQ